MSGEFATFAHFVEFLFIVTFGSARRMDGCRRARRSIPYNPFNPDNRFPIVS